MMNDGKVLTFYIVGIKQGCAGVQHRGGGGLTGVHARDGLRKVIWGGDYG